MRALYTNLVGIWREVINRNGKPKEQEQRQQTQKACLHKTKEDLLAETGM
jgi:hypothetical protein